MLTNTISGGVYIEPTCCQRQHDEAKAANKKNNERAAQIEAETASKRRARDIATASANAPENRFQALLLGSTRLAAKFRRTGDAAKAEKLQDLADEMSDALQAYRAAKTAAAKPVPTPLADAITAAAKELKKALPACFPSMVDAEFFACRDLPLADARTAQVLAADAHGKLAKAVQEAATKFWSLAESAAKTATGRNDDGAIREIETAGSL